VLPLPLAGKLLVATPPLVDPNFDRTVVLVLDHGDHGALGVVINRRHPGDVPESLERWRHRLAPPGGLFVGGPVEPDGVIGLTRADAAPGWEALDLTDDPEDASTGDAPVRLFVGYAGWSAGQLEGELAMDAWVVVDAEPDDAFHPEPERLWRVVLARQPGRLRWLANFPDDVSVN
jgi:putative transcriptional regulator